MRRGVARADRGAERAAIVASSLKTCGVTGAVAQAKLADDRRAVLRSNRRVPYVVIGLLLVAMALAGSVLKRLPLTASMFYLAVGFGLGPAGCGLIRLDPVEHAALLERFTEVAVVISLFSAGLKLRTPLSEWRWFLPVRLASVAMVVTVGLVAAVGVASLGLPLGAVIPLP